MSTTAAHLAAPTESTESVGAVVGPRPDGPAQPGRPRRRRGWLLGAVVCLAVLAGACSQSNTPSFYDQSPTGDPPHGVAENNFMQGCTGASTGKNTTTTLSSTDLCECILKVTEDSIPMSSKDEKERDGGKHFAGYNGQTFTQINDELKTDPNKVPTTLQQAWAKSCGGQGYPESTTTTAKPSSSGGPTTTSK